MLQSYIALDSLRPRKSIQISRVLFERLSYIPCFFWKIKVDYCVAEKRFLTFSYKIDIPISTFFDS